MKTFIFAVMKLLVKFKMKETYWSSLMLSGCGQWRWERDENKWQVVKDHFNITSSVMCETIN